MTHDEVATLCLRNLGVIGADETPEAADLDFVKGKLTRALATLATPAIDIAVWTIDDTPDAYAEAFADYAQPTFSGAYGMLVADVRLAQAGPLARLRELTADVRASAPGTAEYF